MNSKLSILALMVLMALLIGVSETTAHGTVAPVDTSSPADALGTAFTYQGHLTDGGSPASDIFDFAFGLYDDPDFGEGAFLDSVIVGDKLVTDGFFTVELDFGNVFDGTALYLQVGVRPGSSIDAYTTLSPRQALTPTPYAIYAMNATTYLPGTGLTLSDSTFSIIFSSSGSASTAARSDHDHDDQYYTQTELQTSGSAGVHWDNLMSVPAGFADGTDDNTTYTAGEGLMLSDTQFSAQGSPYGNVVVVAKSGGDYTSVKAAVDSIIDATASNPYLVWVAPGVYTETVTMKAWVDIEGAGEQATKITYKGSAFVPNGTVVGADNAELRFLTVENTGVQDIPEEDTAIAIYNVGQSPRLTHVTAIAFGGTWCIGVSNSSYSSPQMTDVTASASGGGDNNFGVYNYSSSPTMTNVTAFASGGIINYGVYNYSSSPQMIDVTASASGGTNNYGVYNSTSSSPQMTDVTASASGGGENNYSVYNYSSSSPQMTNVTASASGGTNSYGVNNFASSPTINNSVIEASGGTNNYGIHNEASSSSYSVKVNNSQISVFPSTPCPLINSTRPKMFAT